MEKKLKTQDFALSRIAAKTWGPSLAKAREVYTKCIRSAIAYGASSFHTPTTVGGRPKGVVRSLAKAQNRSLRIVAGAYKATPIRHLESETFTPPLDLYLNKRLADFEQRLEKEVLETGQGPGGPKKSAASVVAEACNRLFRRFRRKKRGAARGPRPEPQRPTAAEAARATVSYWASQGQGQGLKEPPGERPSRGKGRKRKKRKKKKRPGSGLDTVEALEWAWRERWNRDQVGRPVERLADRAPPVLLFTDLALQKHEGLTKAQSSLLTQARTGAIGLRDFLFRAKVPGTYTPYCECGQGRETVEHLVVWCSNLLQQRTWGQEIRSRRDLQTVLQGARPQRWLLQRVLGWLMGCGRLQEYSLAVRLGLETGEAEEEPSS